MWSLKVWKLRKVVLECTGICFIYYKWLSVLVDALCVVHMVFYKPTLFLHLCLFLLSSIANSCCLSAKMSWKIGSLR